MKSSKENMKIIEFEGLDKSGKFTQSTALAEYLISLGYKVVRSEFHRYDTPTGKLIQEWLYNQYEVDELTIEFLMAADKQAQQEWFNQLEKEGVDYLILDRYLGSQICYGVAKGRPLDWLESLLQHMRKPNISILLDMSPEVSMQRKGKHGDNDRYESDKEFLTKVRKSYLEYFEKSSDRIIIHDCDIKTKEEIAENIKFLVNYFV